MPVDRAFLDGLTVRDIDEDIDSATFRCNEGVEWFIHNRAVLHQRLRISTTTCWLQDRELAGYISSAMSTVLIEDSPQRGALGLSAVLHHPAAKHAKQFPAFLIGMLGVSQQFRRRGLAFHMVQSALGSAAKLSREVGCRFVTVDADKTEEALGLYKNAGFVMVDGQKPERKTAWMYFDLGPRS